MPPPLPTLDDFRAIIWMQSEPSFNDPAEMARVVETLLNCYPRENRKRRTTLGWNCLTLSGVWNDPCLQPRISRIDLGSCC